MSGIGITYAANMSGSEVDIIQGLLKQVTLSYCRDCETYLQPPDTRIEAMLESTELLNFCLEQLNLDEVELILVHAHFVYTEPHTNRIKVKLRVQKAVHGEFLQQDCMVVYVIRYQMCDDCSRVISNLDPLETAPAVVKLLQEVPHNQIFFFILEQHILQHDVARSAIAIKKMDYGIGFFFHSKIVGMKFVEFLGTVAPIKSWSDKKLVSHGPKGNICFYRYTFYVEIPPIICQNKDLAWLPPKAAISLGLVLDINNVSAGSTYALADSHVARVSDDTLYDIRTHLLLSHGNYAPAYDLNVLELDEDTNLVLSLVILVKKNWREKPKLKNLDMEVDDTIRVTIDDQVKVCNNCQEFLFLRDLEEKAKLRFNISLYHANLENQLLCRIELPSPLDMIIGVVDW